MLCRVNLHPSRSVDLRGTYFTLVLLKAFSLYAVIFHPNINRILYSTLPQQQQKTLEKNKNCRVKETKKTCFLFLNLHHNSRLYPRFM
jgi:hypothetical protein